MPEKTRRVALVCFPFWKAYELELQAPWTPEIDPTLPARGLFARGRLAHHFNAVFSQVQYRGVEVIDVERNVVSADVAVAWLGTLAVNRLVEEDLKVCAVPEAVEANLTDFGPRMHTEVRVHPIVVG